MITVSARVNLNIQRIRQEDWYVWSFPSYAPLDDICDRTCEHLQTLRHLQGHHGSIVLSNMMYRLVYFERII